MERRLLKIRRLVWTLLFVMVVTVFDACGVSAEDTAGTAEAEDTADTAGTAEAENTADTAGMAETENTADTADTAETENTADTAGTAEAENTADTAGVAEAENKEEIEEIEEAEETEETEMQVSLADITWEDYHDGVDKTTIHFSFSDGTVIDQELPEWSIVKSIEYRDITGDGIEEVIVYRDFVGNWYDDYIIMDFFKVESGAVTEISPAADLPELSDNVWDTEIADEQSGEYTIVLRMKTCSKILGALYTSMAATVGYDRTQWKMIQKQEIPEWKVAYLKYLLTETDADDCRFWLADEDGDGIPELFCIAEDVQLPTLVLTYKDGTVEESGSGEINGGQYKNGMDFDGLWSILGSVEEGWEVFEQF
ncbi:MAG: hypothetical protein NC429_14490 [Lachnospiraceae bacterium]|nr:hypothetical protein [Lachnospiraceae bacterium]